MSAVDVVFSEIESRRARRLWGANLIARVAGVSADTVVRWVRDCPRCPVKKHMGRYTVTIGALEDWIEQKEAA